MSLQNFRNEGGSGINTVKQFIWLILAGAGIIIMCCGLPASKGHIGTAWTHAHGALFVIPGIILTAVAVIYLLWITFIIKKK